jgi:hypothetical protein
MYCSQKSSRKNVSIIGKKGFQKEKLLMMGYYSVNIVFKSLPSESLLFQMQHFYELSSKALSDPLLTTPKPTEACNRIVCKHKMTC